MKREGDSTPAKPAAKPLLPQPALPKGGGALAPIGERLTPHPQTGTASFSIPLPITPGRGSLTPSLALAYDSGGGASAFGLGWSVGVAAIVRKTDRGLPRYPAFGATDDDEFVFGGEDLIAMGPPELQGDELVIAYRPRVEAEVNRIERRRTATGGEYWVTFSTSNMRSVFGWSAQARVADPADDRRVFRWNVEWTDDDRGNTIGYYYKAEAPYDVGGSYLKAVGYLNVTPRTDRTVSPIVALESWPLVVLFDYGEHDLHRIETEGRDPLLEDEWLLREDPTSNHRATFEIRTRRLCRNVLMLHRITGDGRYDTAPGAAHEVVRSLELVHEQTPRCTYLTGAVAKGWRRSGTGYEVVPHPPIELEYTRAEAPRTSPLVLDAESLDGVAGDFAQALLVDYDGEGLPGVLAERGDAWWYKRPNGNASEARWSPPARIEKRPAVALASVQVQDWNSDGSLDVVALRGADRGVYERLPRPHGTELLHDDWRPFRAFDLPAEVDFADPHLRFVDLDGDGFADLLFVDDERMRWHAAAAGLEARGANGFGPEQRAAMPPHPRPPAGTNGGLLVADMTGDGLADLVEVTHGSVCYWPNLGYGRFGARVVIGNAPILCAREEFDPSRVRFADFDGSGTADLVYLDGAGVRIYPNLAGNSFGAAIAIALPQPARIDILDLWGRGTSTVVWSSAAPRDRERTVRYVDLFPEKPHLLRTIENGHGLTQTIDYAPSTKFYLADRAAGRPWVTRLPFPVQVVERITVVDAVSGSQMVSTCSYHHGHYDGGEREFRGFAMVEQRDAEGFGKSAGVTLAPLPAIERALHRPPVVTRTWFHTGAYAGGEVIARALAAEYFAGDLDAVALADTVLPPGLSPDESREAVRALRGKPLRVEVYAEDADPADPESIARATRPYVVTEYAYTLDVRVPREDRRHPVIAALPRETLAYHYERELGDPRIAHQLVLAVSPAGTPTDTVSIAYARRGATAIDAQRVESATLAHVELVDPVIAPDDHESYRRDIATGEETFELLGLAGESVLSFPEVHAFAATAVPHPYSPFTRASDPPRAAGKHLLARTRHRFYADDAVTLLPIGGVEVRSLPARSEVLAHTEVTLAAIAARDPALDLPAVLGGEAGYVADADGTWWAPSPTVIYDPLAFRVPIATRDAFGGEAHVTYDDLLALPRLAIDAMENPTVVTNDYRTFQPREILDPNGTTHSVDIDVLGIVTAAYVTNGAHGGQLSRMTYAFRSAASPAWVHTETFPTYDPDGPTEDAWVYADGFGREAMRKQRVPDAIDGPQFIGTGRTVFDNKGNAVKKYEPYFSSTLAFEDEADIVERGVTPITHYDPLGRAFRVDLPDGTFTDVTHDPWTVTSRDPIDTLTPDVPWYALRHALPDGDPDRVAAEASLALRATPSIAHLDPLGKTVMTTVDAQDGAPHATREEHDISGKVLAVTDPRDVTVMVTRHDASGRPYLAISVDAGTTTTLLDAGGQPLLSWRGDGASRVRVRRRYDAARRQTALVVIDHHTPGADASSIDGGAVRERAFYRDHVQGALPPFSAGRLCAELDGAGLVTSTYDFAGSVTHLERHVPRAFDSLAEWSGAEGWTGALPSPVDALLDPEAHAIETTYDALQRVLTLATPDGRTQRRGYDRAGRLTSVEVDLNGSLEQVVVGAITYDEKSRRSTVTGGHGTLTTHHYDPLTFRLTRLETTGTASERYQDLAYTYDAAGNITRIGDAAQDIRYFDNTAVLAEQTFTYDALYRLHTASGREHAGQAKADQHLIPADIVGIPVTAQTDLVAIKRYDETYTYDRGGNITQMDHIGGATWTRDYTYAASSNRLATTSIGPITYSHDSRGNLAALPHLHAMVWNHADQLVGATRTSTADDATTLPLPAATNPVYFAYDPRGQRVRKTSRNGAVVRDRIYVGPYEVYREGADVHVTTLSIVDDKDRVAMVETTLKAHEPSQLGTRWRFQHANHLGSSALELSPSRVVLSYEESHPYGTTALSTLQANLAPRRYRFTGMERDDETGLQCHGVRYYAPWLGRWCSSDPKGLADGANLFAYCRGRPSRMSDRTGHEGKVEVTSKSGGPDGRAPTWSTFEVDVETDKMTFHHKFEFHAKTVEGEQSSSIEERRPPTHHGPLSPHQPRVDEETWFAMPMDDRTAWAVAEGRAELERARRLIQGKIRSLTFNGWAPSDEEFDAALKLLDVSRFYHGYLPKSGQLARVLESRKTQKYDHVELNIPRVETLRDWELTRVVEHEFLHLLFRGADTQRRYKNVPGDRYDRLFKQLTPDLFLLQDEHFFIKYLGLYPDVDQFSPATKSHPMGHERDIQRFHGDKWPSSGYPRIVP